MVDERTEYQKLRSRLSILVERIDHHSVKIQDAKDEQHRAKRRLMEIEIEYLRQGHADGLNYEQTYARGRADSIRWRYIDPYDYWPRDGDDEYYPQAYEEPEPEYELDSPPLRPLYGYTTEDASPQPMFEPIFDAPQETPASIPSAQWLREASQLQPTMTRDRLLEWYRAITSGSPAFVEALREANEEGNPAPTVVPDMRSGDTDEAVF